MIQRVAFWFPFALRHCLSVGIQLCFINKNIASRSNLMLRSRYESLPRAFIDCSKSLFGELARSCILVWSGKFYAFLSLSSTWARISFPNNYTHGIENEINSLEGHIYLFKNLSLIPLNFGGKESTRSVAN